MQAVEHPASTYQSWSWGTASCQIIKRETTMRDSLPDSSTQGPGGVLRLRKPAPSQQIKHPAELTDHPEAGWEREVPGLAIRIHTKVHRQNPRPLPHLIRSSCKSMGKIAVSFWTPGSRWMLPSFKRNVNVWVCKPRTNTSRTYRTCSSTLRSLSRKLSQN